MTSQELSMSERKRADFKAWPSRIVKASRNPATKRVAVAMAMAGRPMCPILAESSTAMLANAPRMGKAKPAAFSVPTFSALVVRVGGLHPRRNGEHQQRDRPGH